MIDLETNEENHLLIETLREVLKIMIKRGKKCKENHIANKSVRVSVGHCAKQEAKRKKKKQKHTEEKKQGSALSTEESNFAGRLLRVRLVCLIYTGRDRMVWRL